MVKSIIKRIIVGVGIALCLMAIKERGLIGQVHALSCSVSNRTTSHPLESWHGNILNTSRESHMDISFYDRDTFQNNDSRIYFNDNDSYIDVLVPVTWTMAFQNNPVYNDKIDKDYQFHIQSSPPIFYLIDNTGSNRWYWTMGVWDNGYYRVRYFKSDFPDNYVSLAQIKIGLPTWWYNFVNSTFVSLNGYFQVDHFQCDSNKALKEAIDENTKAVEDVNNSLKDEHDANTSGFLQDINQDYSNNPVSDLITMPITFLQTLNNKASGSCITWDLGALFGTNLKMPCINLQQILGSNLYNLIDMAICLFLAYNLGLMCVTIWNNMTSLKDDFDDMYSPKHVYQGKHSGGDS